MQDDMQHSQAQALACSVCAIATGDALVSGMQVVRPQMHYLDAVNAVLHVVTPDDWLPSAG